METDPADAAEFRMMVELEDRNLMLSAFHSPLAELLAWDASTGAFIAANETAQSTLGFSLRQLIKMNVADLMPSVSTARLRRFFEHVKRRPTAELTFRFNYCDSLGQPRVNRVLLQYTAEPRPTFMAHCSSITHFVEARAAANKAENLLITALESLPDGFVLYDAEDKLVICNERYREIYKQSASAMRKGATLQQILEYGLERQQYADGIGREAAWLAERLIEYGAAHTTVEQQLTNGQWLRIVERQTVDGGRVGLRIDITELKNQQAQLEIAARTDQMTGLMNRRGLNRRLQAMTNALVTGERIAILHVDLDKFKAINDAQGHDAGDFVLRHCATVLDDATETPESVARVGGDEFIVLLKTTQDDDVAAKLALRLIHDLGLPVSFRDRVCNIGASIGIAFFTPHGPDTIDGTLTGADIALNEAKQAGRSVMRIFETTMRNDAVRLIQMAQQIRLGIIANEFEPHYQPQINSLTGEIIGFEALIRWHHPEKGLVPAFDFLVAAERAGLMDQLDHVVMDRACHAAAQIASWGIARPCVSINMSMSQLQDTNIAQRILGYTKTHGIHPRNLRIELLESTLLDERSSVIIENVHKMIAEGFAVELDDFGTGHAAIATLRKFAVHRIKIDRSLVQDIHKDRELQVITGAIINLAGQLDVKVLAEGVETPDEQITLHNLGCYCAQGYLHARPMPLSELRAWIAVQHAKVSDGAYPQKPKWG